MNSEKIITKILLGRKYKFKTKPGLFSKDEIDPGSQLLIENMKIKDKDVVIDLGCGYGPIGIVVSSLTPNGKVYMVDSDIRAVKYSKINAHLNDVRSIEILPSDGFEEIPKDIRFDVVVSNPPSHMPKETIIEFIEEAKKHLKIGGSLYFVTERRIKPMIKREFLRVFGNHNITVTNFQYAVSLAFQK